MNRRYEHIRKIVIENHFPPEVRSANVFHKVRIDCKVAVERYQREIDEIYALSAAGDPE